MMLCGTIDIEINCWLLLSDADASLYAISRSEIELPIEPIEPKIDVTAPAELVTVLLGSELLT